MCRRHPGRQKLETDDVHVLEHHGTKGGDVDGHEAVDEGVEHHNVDGRDISDGAPDGEEAGEANADHDGAGEGVEEEKNKQKSQVSSWPHEDPCCYSRKLDWTVLCIPTGPGGSCVETCPPA